MPGSTASSTAAPAVLEPRTFGPWNVDQLPPAPTGPITSTPQWAKLNRQWINAHTFAAHRDNDRAHRLADAYPEQRAAIGAEARAALNRRAAELHAAKLAFDECSRVMERAGRPIDHGAAWGVAPIVADAIERTAAVRARLATVTTPRPRGAGRPAARAPRRVASADNDDGPAHLAGGVPTPIVSLLDGKPIAW
jgi:hypothetical protein